MWVPAAAVEKKRPHLLRNFLSRQAGGDIDTDWAETNSINPAWYKVRCSHSADSAEATTACSLPAQDNRRHLLNECAWGNT